MENIRTLFKLPIFLDSIPYIFRLIIIYVEGLNGQMFFLRNSGFHMKINSTHRLLNRFLTHIQISSIFESYRLLFFQALNFNSREYAFRITA